MVISDGPGPHGTAAIPRTPVRRSARTATARSWRPVRSPSRRRRDRVRGPDLHVVRTGLTQLVDDAEHEEGRGGQPRVRRAATVSRHRAPSRAGRSPLVVRRSGSPTASSSSGSAPSVRQLLAQPDDLRPDPARRRTAYGHHALPRHRGAAPPPQLRCHPHHPRMPPRPPVVRRRRPPRVCALHGRVRAACGAVVRRSPDRRSLRRLRGRPWPRRLRRLRRVRCPGRLRRLRQLRRLGGFRGLRSLRGIPVRRGHQPLPHRAFGRFRTLRSRGDGAMRCGRRSRPVVGRIRSHHRAAAQRYERQHHGHATLPPPGHAHRRRPPPSAHDPINVRRPVRVTRWVSCGGCHVVGVMRRVFRRPASPTRCRGGSVLLRRSRALPAGRRRGRRRSLRPTAVPYPAAG